MGRATAVRRRLRRFGGAAARRPHRGRDPPGSRRRHRAAGELPARVLRVRLPPARGAVTGGPHLLDGRPDRRGVRDRRRPPPGLDRPASAGHAGQPPPVLGARRGRRRGGGGPAARARRGPGVRPHRPVHRPGARRRPHPPPPAPRAGRRGRGGRGAARGARGAAGHVLPRVRGRAGRRSRGARGARLPLPEPDPATDPAPVLGAAGPVESRSQDADRERRTG